MEAPIREALLFQAQIYKSEGVIIYEKMGLKFLWRYRVLCHFLNYERSEL